MTTDRYADSDVPLEQMTVEGILDCAIARLHSYNLSDATRNPANLQAIFAIQDVQVNYARESRR